MYLLRNGSPWSPNTRTHSGIEWKLSKWNWENPDMVSIPLSPNPGVSLAHGNVFQKGERHKGTVPLALLQYLHSTLTLMRAKCPLDHQDAQIKSAPQA